MKHLDSTTTATSLVKTREGQIKVTVTIKNRIQNPLIQEVERLDAISKSSNTLVVGFPPVAPDKCGRMKRLVEHAVRYAYESADEIYYFEHRLFRDNDPQSGMKQFKVLDSEELGMIAITLDCNFAKNKLEIIKDFLENNIGTKASVRKYRDDNGNFASSDMQITSRKIQIVFETSPKELG